MILNMWKYNSDPNLESRQKRKKSLQGLGSPFNSSAPLTSQVGMSLILNQFLKHEHFQNAENIIHWSGIGIRRGFSCMDQMQALKMQRTAWWIGGSTKSATILETVNESEGQLSCLHGQPHLIWPPNTFSTLPLSIQLQKGVVDPIWWWKCMMVKYFRTPLNFKLYSACRHTCIQVSWPNPCRTGCRLP